MLFKTLEFLRINLNDYINEVTNANPLAEFVRLGNIAYADDDPDTQAADEREMVYISLVNIEEEFTKKNHPVYKKNLNGTVDYKNPPVFINLYGLITANHKDYNLALQRLSQVMSYFQSNSKFTFNSAPVQDSGISFTFDDIEKSKFEVALDLFTLTFEQVNHLWGSLGGKQVPFVLYKIRLIEIVDELILSKGGVITEIHQSAS